MLARARAAAGGAGAFEVVKSEEEWRRLLTPAQYKVLRDHGTERAFTSPLDKEKRAGVFRCAGCERDLFASATKFDSGTGGPASRPRCRVPSAPRTTPASS
jgi:peptide-methionine (R)-S-oxide reductase